MIDAKYLGLTANQLAKMASDLEAENAKLRLLVEAMGVYERMETDVDPLRTLEIREAIKQLAGELGVEI